MKIELKHTSGKVEPVHYSKMGKFKETKIDKMAKGRKVEPIKYGKLTEHGKKI